MSIADSNGCNEQQRTVARVAARGVSTWQCYGPCTRKKHLHPHTPDIAGETAHSLAWLYTVHTRTHSNCAQHLRPTLLTATCPLQDVALFAFLPPASHSCPSTCITGLVPLFSCVNGSKASACATALPWYLRTMHATVVVLLIAWSIGPIIFFFSKYIQ